MFALTIRHPYAQLMVTRAPHSVMSCDPYSPELRAIAAAAVQRFVPMVKTIETRSWPAPASAIGQRIAIHASAEMPRTPRMPEGWSDDIGGWRVRTRMQRARGGRVINRADDLVHVAHAQTIPLAFRAVVGSAVLAACVPVETPDTETARAERIVWTSGAGDLKIAHLDRQLERMAEMGMPIGTDDPGLLALGTEPLHIPHPWITDADVSDQLSFGDFAPGRWAWLFTDAAPTTGRCPLCWGERLDYAESPPARCPACDAEGRCAPVPAKGRLGLWRWNP